MKLDELEVGKIYKCRLSGNEVLVCEVEKEISKETKPPGNNKPGKVVKKIVTSKIGKSFITQNDGNKGFSHDELFDGQLEEILKTA